MLVSDTADFFPFRESEWFTAAVLWQFRNGHLVYRDLTCVKLSIKFLLFVEIWLLWICIY